VNGQAALEPLAMEFLAREAMFHACAVRNANRSIQVPLVVKPNRAGVAADSWRRTRTLRKIANFAALAFLDSPFLYSYFELNAIHAQTNNSTEASWSSY
jgi:hypothetical protein